MRPSKRFRPLRFIYASIIATEWKYLSSIPSDISAPSISNVRASSVTTSSAVITWQTSEPSDSQVEYYLTPDGCHTLTVVDPILVATHSVTLTGLSPGTGYRFRRSCYAFILETVLK